MSDIVLNYIRREFERRKDKNPRYSLRSFAQSVDFDSASLSQIFNGRRRLTYETARQILNHFEMTEPERNQLLLAFDNPKNYAPPSTGHRVLTEDQLTIMAGWQFYAILAALEIDQQQFTQEEVGKLIGCPPDVTRESFALLMELGMVSFDGQKYIPINERLTTTHNIPSPALVKAHQDYINKALESLTMHRGEYDFSGITMAISKKKLPEAQRRIREFRRSLSEFLNDGERDAVYRINIQLFPLK